MTEFFNRKPVTSRRRELRAVMPEPEVVLWAKLRGRQVEGVKFRRQYSVGPYIIDFFAPQAKLAVEVDGETHSAEGAPEHDRRKQAYIEGFGIRVLRFTNRDVLRNLEGVLVTIQQALLETVAANPLGPEAGPPS